MENYSKILGFNIYNNSISALINDEIQWNDKKVIVSGNPEVLYSGLNDKSLYHYFKSKNSIIVPDGIGTVILCRLKKKVLKEKIAGIEVLTSLLKICSEKNKKVYILGANKDILNEAVKNIACKFSGINICGYHDGYFQDTDKIINKINGCSPDLLVVALGCPKQEKFIYENFDKLNFNIAMGVGGSIDILGGKIKRAPKWMINIGLEWVYRVIKEPFRIKRLFVIPKFILRGLKEKENGRK
ncbi:WecB/TagA/CpsF family glycosyltransferase [Oceanirhabdus sp. W0125-5]|uniref:WecB/TagA/CpsF family glycosyltransferase n=1 Tax=Oceanirhabdus sp. W0125-5 TaxID=2999116 RepID=UPI0022F32CEA|nr:WecB/TagA/CpsF family glycosyltransferase [Oceanirhabdus sp. W0125-5]WBW99453.1 WecB/TagA/CpsF family glycosyltransferase [Oceanirhabdus sp. W0125-5]